MRTVNIKIIDPTYGELAKALKSLGFKDKSKDDTFWYVHEGKNAWIRLPMKDNHEIVERTSYAAFTFVLEGKGILNDRDALGHIIEKNRLIKEATRA